MRTRRLYGPKLVVEPPFFAKSWAKSVFPLYFRAKLSGKDSAGLAFALLGLVGEAGELFAKVDSGENKWSVILEIGDVLWYALVLTAEWGRDPYSHTDLERLFGPRKPLVHSNYTKYAQNVLVLASKLAEKGKKYLRDGSPPEDFDSLQALVDNASYLLTHYGSSMAECMAMNNRKLESRADRGVIKGSGDYR